MKYIAVYPIICLSLFGCYSKKLSGDVSNLNKPNCLQNYDTVAISSIIEEDSYYWKLDSLGNNGYRRIAMKFLRATKNYDVDFDFVIKYYGPGLNINDLHANQKNLYIIYDVYNTEFMGPEYSKLSQNEKLTFEFDKTNKKLTRIR